MNGNAKTISCVDNLYYDWDIYNPYDVSFVSGSVKVWEVTESGGKEISDFSYTMDESQEIVDNKTRSHKIINFTLPDSKHLKIEYEYHFSGPLERWNVLRNTFSINGSSQDSTSSEKSVNTCVSESGGVFNSTGINFYKVDAANYNKLLSGGKFTLKKYVKNQDGQGEWSVVREKIHADEKGLIDTSNLITYNVAYWLTEEEAPDGYECGDLGENGYKFILRSTDTTNYPISQPDDFDGEECTTGAAKYLTNSKVQTSANLKVKKVVDGEGYAEDEDFSFSLSAVDNAPMPEGSTNGSKTVSVKNRGEANFGEIHYTEEGTYQYKITESKGTTPGMSYDTAEHRVTVTVSKTKETGELTATVNYGTEGATELTITNMYTATGSATFHAHKTLAGAALEAGKFSFVLKKGNAVVATGTNDADGNVTFHAKGKTEEYQATYTLEDAGKADTYTISEVKPENADSHLTYDESVYTVTVTPTDNGKGALTATPVYSKEGQEGTTNKAEFVNTYTTEGEAILQITKAMSGRELTDKDKFEFQLKDQDEKVLQTKVNTGSTVVFDALTYGKSDVGKTYTYTIHESSNKESEGITNGADVTATVKVSEGADHKISTEVSYTSNATITNTYTPEKVQVSGSKNWNDDGNAAGTRPGSITIRLYANGSEIGHKTVTEKDGWSWNWTGLNRYDTDHKEISYTISEDAVEGYTSSISGYNVTNTVNKPQVGSVILTKVDATTGTALAGAVFDLYRANNTKVGTYTTNAGGVLRVDGLTFGDYYFVETKAPEGYALESQRAAFTINAATTVSAPASVRVTNKPVDEKIGVSAAKVWDDENNTDGVRPSSVTFRLFADGVEIGSAQASEANGWTVSFGNLPKTRNGVAISYAVKEDEVGNYDAASYAAGRGSDGSVVFPVTRDRETVRH